MINNLYIGDVRWYGDYIVWLTVDMPWIIRGGGYGDDIRAGVYSVARLTASSGADRTARVVLLLNYKIIKVQIIIKMIKN